MSESAQPQANPAEEQESEHTISREQQMVFGTDGDLEPDSDSVETSLEAFGAEVDHSEGSGELAKPSATQFGVDDRAQVPQRQNNQESDQRSLFADVESDQQTLGGESAANRCLFENDSEKP